MNLENLLNPAQLKKMGSRALQIGAFGALACMPTQANSLIVETGFLPEPSAVASIDDATTTTAKSEVPTFDQLNEYEQGYVKLINEFKASNNNTFDSYDFGKWLLLKKEHSYSIDTLTGLLEKPQTDIIQFRATKMIGKSQFDLGQYDKAIVAWSKSLDVHTDVPTLLSIGSAYNKLGEQDKAIQFIRKAIDLDDTHADSHYFLGLMYESTGNTKAARSAFENAIKLDTKYEKKLSPKLDK